MDEKLLTMSIRFPKIILAFLIVSLLFACNSEESNLPKENAEVKVNPINPNGDSELALLMRQMYLDAEKVKDQVINDEGNITVGFIEELQKVHSAIPTDPKVKTPDFKVFNDQLIASARSIQTADGDKTSAFNTFVERCIACHRSYCPGPVKRIKKLRIKALVE